MTIKYFCDRCEKEKDIFDIKIILEGRIFNKSFCKDCVDELMDLLKTFYKTESPPFVKQKEIY